MIWKKAKKKSFMWSDYIHFYPSYHGLWLEQEFLREPFDWINTIPGGSGSAK
jgi:hypothetical protein